jgi:mono/diheme cytochrome c family protein
MTTNEIILSVVTAVLVVFSLTVAIVIPKRHPEFPGRKGLGLFFLVSTVLVAGMLLAVEVIGEEEGHAEAAEVEPPSGEPAPPGEPPPPGEPAPPAAPGGDPAAGKEVFLGSAGCGSCHALADAGTTGAVGPDLDASQPSFELVVDRVTNGQGLMPPFEGELSEQEIQDVAAYVVQATSG